MKIEKNKHDHKLTHLLKVGIFAMLMIAPLFASCSQLMYVTFNKNAYQSTQITGTEYYTTYKYETNEVNSTSDLVVGNIYKFDTPIGYSWSFYAKSVYYLHLDDEQLINFEFSQFAIGETYKLNVRYNNSNLAIQLYEGDEFVSNVIVYGAGFQNVSGYFVYDNLINDNLIPYVSASDYLGEKTVHERPIQALDNAFYYGVEKMTESPLFNWTQNTALYTGIKAMTDNLQVQTNVIAVLVTYWTILTIIYIIIDILLALFTKLTHLLVRSD